MSRYAIIHVRHAEDPQFTEVEATFFAENHELAIQVAIEYAVRSSFFDPESLDEEFMGTIERELQRYNRLMALSPRPDILFIKRVFEAPRLTLTLTQSRTTGVARR